MGAVRQRRPDAARHQADDNLVSNVVKFTPFGGREAVTIGTGRRRSAGAPTAVRYCAAVQR